MAAAYAEQMNAGVWFDRPKVKEAEEKYQEYLAKELKQNVSPPKNEVSTGGGIVAQKIEQARKQIQQTLEKSSYTTATISSGSSDLQHSVDQLRQENQDLKSVVNKLQSRLESLESRLSAVEGKAPTATEPKSSQSKPAPKEEESDEDSDIDCFGSTDEEEEAEIEKIKQARIAAYHEKKSKKPAVVAKSTIILDVKPWDDETDLDKMEKCVRGITAEGLLWGSSKRIEVAFGIKKLQITCVVVDDLIGTDFLEDEITKFEDMVRIILEWSN